MRNYFELDEDLYIKDRWQLAGPIDHEERDEREFSYGNRIELRGLLVARVHTPGTALDFSQTVSVVPIISKRFADAIRKLIADHVQLFPVYIEGHVGFEVMNTCMLISCVDESRSDFTKWTSDSARPDRAGEYHYIRILRLNTDQIPFGVHAFRILHYSGPLIVSQAFVDAILPLNPTGVKLKLVT